jgi:hypothetical protein
MMEPVSNMDKSTYNGPPIPPGAWMVDRAVLVDAQGRPAAQGDPCQKQVTRAQGNCTGYQLVQAYQPASRYWLFQAIESGIYLALSTLLLLVTVYWVRRRVT